MSQKHLYGTGSPGQYQELTPPVTWEDLGIEATVNDNSVKAEITEGTFFFVGDTATFIQNTWIPQYGVHNGLPYRIVVDNQEIVFDGFLVLSEREIMSKTGPIILSIPVRDLTDNLTSFDRVSIFTQSLLLKQGFITPQDYVFCPVVEVSKRGAKDRAVALTNLAYTVANTFFSIIQDLLSALSDMIGLSVVLGVVEFFTLMLKVSIQINQLIDLIFAHRDLLLASQTWYNGIPIKAVIEAAFEKLGKTVEWGIIEDAMDHLFVLHSQNGTLGALSPGNLSDQGTLRSGDWGYLISESLQEVQKLFNTRQDDKGDVVWIKTKTDPDWTDSPAFTAENVVIETTKQYQNGFYRNKTEEVFATTRIVYQYDPSDAWTLTENSGDAHEIHRDLINELDPRMNTLKGLQDIQINWAMAVRYDPVTDVLVPIMQQIFGDFGQQLGLFQQQLTAFAQFIDPGSNSDSNVALALQLTPLNFLFPINAGGLKVEDNTWGIPKLIWGNLDANRVLNIPENFKDFIGAKPIYDNYYLPDSPADVNNFEGQYTEIRELTIPFSLANFQASKENPYFILDSEAKFLHINWMEDDRKATTDIEKRETFDNNITEEEV